MIRKYWCIVLSAIVYFVTLWFWFNTEMDVLWSSIFNYCIFFPICGIILGIHYGKCETDWKWVLPVCVFIAVMIHDMLVGYALFGMLEFDPDQIPMYLVTVLPCVFFEIVFHIRMRKREAVN